MRLDTREGLIRSMIFRFDEFELEPVRLELRRDGHELRADRMVLRLLAVLVRNAGELVTKAELHARVWEHRAVSKNVISVSIARLRKTLGHKAGEREFVVSVQGRGYRFVRPVTLREPEEVPIAATRAAPSGPARALVGRDGVMRHLRAALAASRDGRGGLCLLSGEAGIGKTAAVEQLTLEAEASGLQVAWAYCAEVGDAPPLWPFTQLVRALMSQRHGATLSASALPSEVRWLLPEVRDDRGADMTPPVAKHRLFEAMLTVLERAAGHGGCVLIVDDLQRADAASIELLRYWMDRIARSGVLLVATLRTVLPTRSPASLDLSHVIGHRNCTRIALERLELASVQAYVRGVLPDPDGALAAVVWAKSEGNPFFMVELARQLADVEQPDARSLSVSGAALQLLRPRILELDADTRGLLSWAAVIGRRFELGLLQKLTGLSLQTLIDQLDAAIASQTLVLAEGSTVFAFGHELVRELLYDELAPEARRMLHLRVGETLAQLSVAGRAVPSATLAYHFHAALPVSDAATTLTHCQRAALDATQVFAHTESIEHLRRALAALSLYERPNPTAHVMLLLQQAVSARISGSADCELLVHDAAVVARAMQSGLLMIQVALLLHLHPGFPTPPLARALLEEGIALLPPHETAHRGAALARLATCGPIAFDAARSHAQVAHARALVGVTGAVIPAYNVHSAAHYLTSGPGTRETSLEATNQLRRLCQDNPQMLRVSPLLLELDAVLAAHQRGELEAADDAREALRRRCHELGTREFSWHVERYDALARLGREPHARVAEALRALHAQARAVHVMGSELMCVFDRVLVLDDVVSPDTLRRVAASSPHDPPSVWSIKVQTLAAAGLHDEARAALESVPAEALSALPRDRDYVGTLGALARAAVTLSSREHIMALGALLAPHEAYHAVHVSFLCLGPVARLRAELESALAGRGRPSESLQRPSPS